MADDRREFEALLAAACEGVATPGQRRRLAELLRASPDLRAEYVGHMAMHGLLTWRAGLAGETPTAEPSGHPRFGRLGRGVAGAAVAAGLLVGAFIGRWPAAAAAVRVEVVSADAAETRPGERPIIPGETWPMTGLDLVAGRVSLRLESGVGLDVIAPAQMTFESDRRVLLAAGRLTADARDAGRDFAIVTESGEVVEQGTRFSVEATPGGDTGVVVFAGRVRTRTKDNPTVTFLDEGEAARFSAAGLGLKRWDQIALAVSAAGLADRPYAGVIRSVRDNLGGDDLRPFYGVVRRGMRPGALAYTDKPNPRWAPDPDADALPDWLAGADLVRTYHLFRQRQGYELRLTVNEPAAVYVLASASQPAPDWLATTFTETGTRIRVGPWHVALTDAPGAELGDDGLPYFAFDVWRAEVRDEVRLGPAGPAGPHTLMYGLAVKALADR